MKQNNPSINHKAKRLLQTGRVGLVVVKEDKIVFQSTSDGVRDLLWCSNAHLLDGTTVFDSKIGLAAAKLTVWSGSILLYATIASKAAVAFCKTAGVLLTFDKCVDVLYVDSNDRGCLLEKAALKAQSLSELITFLEDLTYIKLAKAPADGVFPMNYYTTSNRETQINLNGSWILVENTEMDKGICINTKNQVARCVAAIEVHKGDDIVVGELGQGIRETFKVSENNHQKGFSFMTSEVSSERSKEVLINKIATMLKEQKLKRNRILFVGGPAIVHTGAGKYLAGLVHNGYVDILFGGNAIAAHDLEENYLGSCLGVNIKTGESVAGGSHSHLRTINAARYYGGIKNFIKKGFVKRGIFYECVTRNIKVILAGSIRDDGPLTDVITDSVKAQMEMRKEVRKGLGIAIMVATTLHSVATGNLLPERVTKVIVDDNVASVTKLVDRGTNAIGIVTDCAYFLSELCRRLKL